MSFVTNAGATRIRIAARGQTPALRAALEESEGIVAKVGSTGVRSVEPLVGVTGNGSTGWFLDASAATGEEVVTALDDGMDAILSAADTVVEHDPERERMPTPSVGELGVGVRQVLGLAGWLRPAEPNDYAETIGFDESTVDRIDDVGATVRGRGWGDWCQDQPLLDTWETARESDGSPTVIVNGHGNAADTLLLSSCPFAVLDGADAVARATGADRIVVFVSEADAAAVEGASAAAERFPDPAASLDVVTGPDVYRAAEPTMAIEAIEGNHRLEARLRPPGPEQIGIHGQPTVVHTARTVAHLATALADDGPSQTRLVTVTGDVETPATVELADSAVLSDALEAVDIDGEFKGACVGGRFGGLTASLEVRPDPETLSEAGLGTEGIVDVLTADRCVVEFVGKRAQFAADANCGRCVPCREGTTQLAELLRDIYDGQYDPDGIEELSRVMETSSICTFGVDASRPARTAITEFESEFHAHADGRCPTGSCPQPIEV